MPDFTPILDPLDGLSTSTVDEVTRATLWRSQMAQRMAFRGRVERSLIGNGQRAVALQGKHQPLLNYLNDQLQPPAPDDDEVQTQPITNQDLNL